MIESGAIAIDWLQEASLRALQRQLRRGEYHVFHFIGHGGYDQDADDGVLLFQDEVGRGRRVSGIQLGTILADEVSLRLAVLNSCEGARSSLQDPFSGVATSLIEREIPAVIGMQFEITDRAAIVFAGEFYSALADGLPVDSSVAEARKAIYADQNDIEWGTPVLFMRVADGRLFDVQTHPPIRPADALAAPAVTPPPIPDEPLVIAAAAAASTSRTRSARPVRQRKLQTRPSGIEWTRNQPGSKPSASEAERIEAERIEAERIEAERIESANAGKPNSKPSVPKPNGLSRSVSDVRRPSPSSPNESRPNPPSATSRPSKPLTAIGQPLPPPRTDVTKPLLRPLPARSWHRQSRSRSPSRVDRFRTGGSQSASARQRAKQQDHHRHGRQRPVQRSQQQTPASGEILSGRATADPSFSLARAIARAALGSFLGLAMIWAFVVIAIPSDVEGQSIEDLFDLFVREAGLTVLTVTVAVAFAEGGWRALRVPEGRAYSFVGGNPWLSAAIEGLIMGAAVAMANVYRVVRVV